MSRNHDRTPSWQQARDCEILYGREWAEKVWGSVVFDDINVSMSIETRLDAMEKRINHLFVLLAMKASQRKEANKVWKPSDGLASREV